jgi:hypothetical protein
VSPGLLHRTVLLYRYAAPVGVRSLMQQFEQLMSPGKDVRTPQNMEGVAAHTAWDQATAKK